VAAMTNGFHAGFTATVILAVIGLVLAIVLLRQSRRETADAPAVR